MAGKTQRLGVHRLNHSPLTVEAIDSDGIGIRVVFVRVADRYAHRIELVGSDRASVALESIEGDNQDDWPPSPPLQQLTIESRQGNRTVALLVGAAGRTHWSASVQSDPERRQITFDVACRLGETPRRLSSSYRTSSDATTVPLDRQPQFGIEPADDAVSVIIDRSEQRWVIRPSMTQTPAPTTVRWTYRAVYPASVESGQ